MTNDHAVDLARVNEVLSTFIGLPVTYVRIQSGGDLRFRGQVHISADASLWSIRHDALGHFEAQVDAPEDVLWKLLGLIRGRVSRCETAADQVLQLSTDLGTTLVLTPDDQGHDLEYWDVLTHDDHCLAAWPDGSFVESRDGLLRLPGSG